LIDEKLIFNDTSFRLHHFESTLYFKFSEHVESELHLNNHVFGDYFLVPELNISINLSLIDPIQFEISDLSLSLKVSYLNSCLMSKYWVMLNCLENENGRGGDSQPPSI
jgi:hypothetical protein